MVRRRVGRFLRFFPPSFLLLIGEERKKSPRESSLRVRVEGFLRTKGRERTPDTLVLAPPPPTPHHLSFRLAHLAVQ